MGIALIFRKKFAELMSYSCYLKNVDVGSLPFKAFLLRSGEGI